MAQLPACLVRPARPIGHVEIDCTGPFWTNEGRRKNALLVKTYLIIFVCVATKSYHIVIVSDLSKNAFLASFDRLCFPTGYSIRYIYIYIQIVGQTLREQIAN